MARPEDMSLNSPLVVGEGDMIWRALPSGSNLMIKVTEGWSSQDEFTAKVT